MQHELSELRGNIQEQRTQLTMAQQQMRETMQGNTDYEQRVRHEMHAVMAKYELKEHRADMQTANNQGHHQYLRTVAEAQPQQGHVRRWEQPLIAEQAQI